MWSAPLLYQRLVVGAFGAASRVLARIEKLESSLGRSGAEKRLQSEWFGAPRLVGFPCFPLGLKTPLRFTPVFARLSLADFQEVFGQLVCPSLHEMNLVRTGPFFKEPPHKTNMDSLVFPLKPAPKVVPTKKRRRAWKAFPFG